MSFSSFSSRFRSALPFVVLLALFAFSIALRADAIVDWSSGSVRSERWWAHEAELHFRDALWAYKAIPFSEGRGLPLMTPNDLELETGVARPDLLPFGNGADNSAFASTSAGRGFYVSFPPGSFLFAWGSLSAFGAVPNHAAIVTLNLCLQLFSAFLLMTLLRKTLSGRASNDGAAVMALVGASAYLFAVEPMHDHVATFWAQHVMQPLILLVPLLIMARSDGSSGREALRCLALASVSFAGVWIEWTAHTLNGAAFLVCLCLAAAESGKSGWRMAAAGSILFGEVMGSVSLLSLYDGAMGAQAWFSAIANRASVRSGDSDHASRVLRYVYQAWLAYGPWLLWAIAMAALSLATRLSKSVGERSAAFSERVTPAWVSMGCLGGALAENVPMMGHATVYAFDQLKAIPFVVLCGCLLWARAVRSDGVKSLAFGGAAAMAAAVWSVIAYAELFGNPVMANGTDRMWGGVCPEQFDRVAEVMASTLRPGERVAINREPGVVISGGLGRRPLLVGTLGDALSVAETGGPVRLFLIGGVLGFGSDDAPRFGRVGGHVLVSGDSGRVGVTVSAFPIRERSVIASDGSAVSMLLLPETLAGWLRPGDSLDGDVGLWSVSSVSSDGNVIASRVGESPSEVSAPTRVSFSIPPDRISWSSSFLVSSGGRDVCLRSPSASSSFLDRLPRFGSFLPRAFGFEG
jgi:hypothetical protein